MDYVPIEVDWARGPIFGSCHMRWYFSAFQTLARKKNDEKPQERLLRNKKKKAKKVHSNKVKTAANVEKLSMDELEELLEEQSKIEYCIDLKNQKSQASVKSGEELPLPSSSSTADTVDSHVKKMTVSAGTGYNVSVCHQVTSMQHGYSRSHPSNYLARLGTSTRSLAHPNTLCPPDKSVCHCHLKSLVRVYLLQSWDIQTISTALKPGVTPDSSSVSKELSKQDVVEMEAVLFGCVDHRSVNLPAVSLRSLIGNRHIHGDVRNCFLQGLVISHPDHLVEYLPSFFLSSIIDNTRSPNYMTTVALERRNIIFASNLVFLPYHQSNWSMIGLYPKLKLVVHCDSLPSDAADSTVVNAVATYIAKCNVISNRRDDRKDWTFIPLHKYCLQSQSNGFSCGAFACAFASLRDFHLGDVALPLVRYWIGNIALQGSEYVPLKAKPSSQWDDTSIEKCTVRATTIDGFTKGHPPFESLSSFLYSQVNGTTLNDLSSPHENGNDLKTLFDGFSRRRIQNEDNELKTISVEFLQYSSTKAHHLLEEIRNLNPSNPALLQRLNALCSRIAEKENKILPSFGKAASFLSNELYAIATRTREAEHSTKRYRKREYVYDIARSSIWPWQETVYPMGPFQELLTLFFMQTRGYNFQEATKHM